MSRIVRVSVIAMPSAVPDAPPKLLRRSDRTTPLCSSTSGPLEPSPGYGPAVSSGISVSPVVLSAVAVEAVVDGLRQTATTRSNLALFNPSATAPVSVAYDVHDGATGAKVLSSASVDLPPLGWTQVDRVLLGTGATEAFVRVRRTSPGGTFAAYAVLNDGAAPGERTGDGSYVGAEAYDPPD